VTQLIEVLDNIGSQLDHGDQVIYLDTSKAFDKVSHVRLLHRLREFGFGWNLLMWFDSHLKNRRQQTTVLGATSTALSVTPEYHKVPFLARYFSSYIPMIYPLPSLIRT
jgi:hypothetical protein